MNTKRNKKKEGFLNVKQSARSALGKAWKRKWVVAQQNTSTAGRSLLVELYMEKGAYHKTVTSLLLQDVISVERTRSKTQEHALEISTSTKVLLGVSGDSETDTQEWLAWLRLSLMAPEKELPSPPGIPEDFIQVSIIPNKDTERLSLSGDYYAHISRTCINLYNTRTGELCLDCDLRHLKRFMLISKCHPQDSEKIVHILPSKRSQHGEAEIIFFSNKGKELVESIYERLSNAMTVKARRSRSTSMLFEISPQELEMMLKNTEQPQEEALMEDEEVDTLKEEQKKTVNGEEEVNGEGICGSMKDAKESNGTVLAENVAATDQDKTSADVSRGDETCTRDGDTAKVTNVVQDVEKPEDELNGNTTNKGLVECETTEQPPTVPIDAEDIEDETTEKNVDKKSELIGNERAEDAVAISNIKDVAEQLTGINTENNVVDPEIIENNVTQDKKSTDIEDAQEDDKANQTIPEEMDEDKTEAATAQVQEEEAPPQLEVVDTLEDGTIGEESVGNISDYKYLPEQIDSHTDEASSTKDDPCPGVDNQCPGVDNQCPGVDDPCPGVDNQCPGVDDLCTIIDGANDSITNDGNEQDDVTSIAPKETTVDVPNTAEKPSMKTFEERANEESKEWATGDSSKLLVVEMTRESNNVTETAAAMTLKTTDEDSPTNDVTKELTGSPTQSDATYESDTSNLNQNNNNSSSSSSSSSSISSVPAVRRTSQTVMPDTLTSRMAEALRNAHIRKMSMDNSLRDKSTETEFASPGSKQNGEVSEIIV